VQQAEEDPGTLAFTGGASAGLALFGLVLVALGAGLLRLPSRPVGADGTGDQK
jgi:hypothetical protein